MDKREREIFGLLKVPDNVLIKDLRCEIGKRDAYILELEERLKEKENTIDSLTANDKEEIRKMRKEGVFREYQERVKHLERIIGNLRKDNMDLIQKLHKKAIEHSDV